MQIVWSRRGGRPDLTHVGSAHDESELAVLMEAARERMAAGQGELDLGLDGEQRRVGRPLTSTGSQMRHLWQALNLAYEAVGLAGAAADEVFRDLVLARVVEPTSKVDSIRVLAEVGYPTVSYPTLKRHLRTWSAEGFRELLSAALAAHAQVGPKSLVLYDVTTLWFETDKADEFRVPGFSKERRLEPQITIGLLTDAAGFPLMVNAFEGNAAETTTMIPTIKAFLETHQLDEVVVVADAGMVCEANKAAIEAEGLRFVIGEKIPNVPYQLLKWQREHPGQEPPDGLVLTQPWPPGPNETRRTQVRYYQYRADRARRTLRGIDTQVAKAERAVAGKVPVKRNKYVALNGGTRKVDRDLEAKHRTLAGWKAYVTNIDDPTPELVIGAYHQLWHIEKSFRMSKSDLAARPVYARTRDSIEAHLTIVFAALAVSRWIETTTGWSIKKFVRTTRCYRTTYIKVGNQTLPAEEPLPDDLATALDKIRTRSAAH